jgi:hypothetical protein
MFFMRTARMRWRIHLTWRCITVFALKYAMGAGCSQRASADKRNSTVVCTSGSGLSKTWRADF